MASQQKPIDSGFGAESTAGDVLAGVDLTARLAIVTGGYSGIGTETTAALSRAGATVVVPARRPDQARSELAGLERVEVDELDLAEHRSIHDYACRFLAQGRPIDILVNNAGVMANPLTRVGPGWESQFGVNHLGHFALTNLLWPALADGGARVVSVSSRGHRFSGIRWDDLQWERSYDKWQAYGQAKTANILFALHLDELGKDAGVRAFSVYPGGIRTPLQRHLSQDEMVGMGWYDADGNSLIRWKTTEQGAATSVWAATSAELDGLGGTYCADCEVSDVDSGEPTTNGVAPYAVDPQEAATLWAVSAGLTGVDAFA